MGCRKFKFDRCWRKNKAGISINNSSEKNCLIFSSTNSRICIRKHWSEAEFQSNAEHWNLKKVYTREYLLVFAYTVSYWPGCYALRGVIEFKCMLKDGGSPFSQKLYLLMNQFDANLPWFIKRLGSIIKTFQIWRLSSFYWWTILTKTHTGIFGSVKCLGSIYQLSKMNYIDVNLHVW